MNKEESKNKKIFYYLRFRAPIIYYLFTHKGQISRSDLIGNIIISFLIFGITFYTFDYFAGDSFIEYTHLILLILLFLSLSSSFVRRAKDIGFHPIWCTTLLIPFANFITLYILFFNTGWAEKKGISNLLAIQKIIAEADGPVNQSEMDTFNYIWTGIILDKEVQPYLSEQFGKGGMSLGWKHHYFPGFKKEASGQREKIYFAWETLVQIAKSDGAINNKEKSVLHKFNKQFGYFKID